MIGRTVLLAVLTMGLLLVNAGGFAKPADESQSESKQVTNEKAVENATNRVVIMRGGIRNALLRFSRDRIGRVAFLGGSITEMDGYRPMVCERLRSMYPDTKFDFINAGISSTCSTTGAFRLADHVLSKGRIDLLFVEFAVNDNQDAHHTPTECIRGMEGIVRHARKSNPLIDIVFLYTSNESHIEDYQNGRMPEEIAAHERVAEHYDIPSIHLVADVARRLKAGEFDWTKDFGGVHPAPFGNRIYAEHIMELVKASKESIGADAKLKPHALPRPLDKYSYSDGRLVDVSKAQLQSGWEVKIPDWANIPGPTRSRFNKIPLLVADEPGAELTFPFEGTAVGVFVVAGPDAGMLDYRIDDGSWKKVDLFHRFSAQLHYPRTVMFADELKDARHELTLRVSAEHNAKSSGTAARIVDFVVN